MDDIEASMKEHYDPTCFVVRERFKFWSDMKRKPGETIAELASRIRQEAATCNFTAIKKPQDEALRTKFMCSVNNEAVLKCLFKMKNFDLTFEYAVKMATEVEEAAKVAKETVFGSRPAEVHKLKLAKKPANPQAKPQENPLTCFRCGKSAHSADKCRFKEMTCLFCDKKGHIQAACRKKRAEATVKPITKRQIRSVFFHKKVPQLEVPVILDGRIFKFEADTGAGDNFYSMAVWKKLGQPSLSKVDCL